MKLTLKKLKSLNPCEGSIKKYIDAGRPDTVENAIKYCIASNNRELLNDANWLIVRMVRTKTDRVKYKIYAASQILHLFECRFPEDKRPRNAINTAKNYIKNPYACIIICI